MIVEYGLKHSKFRVFFLVAVLLLPPPVLAQINIRNYIELGKRDLFNKDNTAAIHRFNEIIKINPQLFQAYFFRGMAKYNLGDYVGAKSDFSKTISLHPYFSHAYHYRGITEERLNNYHSALKDYNTALEIDPVNPDIYSSRGFTRLLMNDTIGALQDFNEGIMLDPYNIQALLNRSMVWTQKKEYDKALKDCNKAIMLDKYNTEAIYRRGLIWYNQENYRKALKDFNFLIKVDSSNSRAFYYRALTAYKMNDLAGAIKDYDRVLELNPLNALTFYNRAILKTQVGDEQGAIMDYDRVTELNPNNIFTYFNRGTLKLKTGNLEGSLKDFTKVIQLYPGFVPAYINRSVVRRDMNDLTGAMQDQKIAEKISNDTSLKNTLSQIDSSYFNSIIELKANFDNGNLRSKNTSMGSLGVQMKKPYVVSFRETPNPKEFYAGNLEPFNKTTDKKNYLTFVLADEEKPQTLAFEKIAGHYRIKSNSFKGLILEGLIYGYNHDYNKAFKTLALANQQKPDEYIYYFILAGLKFQLTEVLNSIDISSNFLTIGDRKTNQPKSTNDLSAYYKEILELYNRCILLQPNFALAWFNRAYIKSLLNDPAGAIFDYGQAVSLYEELAPAYFNRGLIYIYMNNKEQGCEELSKAGELGIQESYFVIRKYCQ